MNNFDDWSQIISKYLNSESDPLGSLTKYELEGDAARTAFIRAVLERFLPEIYGIGSGQIMDTSGKMSGNTDIIIYRKDFPRLDLPGSRDIYLYESVIATIEVTAKLVKKSFFEALDQCASLADLNPQIDPKVMTSLAVRNQLSLNENKQYVHPDPIRTARFSLIGRPLSFIYAFSGYKTSTSMMVDTLNAWVQDRHENNKQVDMKSLPAVIATQGCFAWRNSAPFSMNNDSLMGVGLDTAPVRLIVLQILHTLSKRLRVTTDAYGLKPALDGYLNRMPPPVIDLQVGKAVNPQEEAPNRVEQTAKLAYKKITSPVEKPAAKPVKMAVKEVTAKPVIETKPDPTAKVLRPVAAAASKPLSSLNVKPEAVDAPFPVPSAEFIPELDPNPAEEGRVEPGTSHDTSFPSLPITQPEATRKPVSPVASTPKPAVQKAVKQAVDIELKSPLAEPKPELVAAIDSADAFIETVKMPAVVAASTPKPAVKKSVNPTVDIELKSPLAELRPEPVAAIDSANGYIETVKIPAAMPKKEVKEKQNTSATEDFMETVKLNLSSKEPFPHLQPKSEPEPEPFTSTIPQLTQ